MSQVERIDNEKAEGEPKTKTAWIFAGQGTQEVGMGLKLFQNYETAKTIYTRANQTLGYPITDISFQGPETLLNQTVYAQPAILTYNLACQEVLKEHGREFDHLPVLAAGHSLGEYNALIAAGALTFEDALRLVQKRAEAMQYACDLTPSGMIAVVSPTREDVNYLQQEFELEIATVNTHDQVVFGGRIANIDSAEEYLKVKKLKGRKLNVAGAFHTSLMAPAREQFTRDLNKATIVAPKFPVITNTTAQLMTTKEQITAELKDQITTTVRWRDTIDFMNTYGVEKTLEVGEKGILSSMHKKVLGGVVAGTVVTITGVAAAIIWHKHHEEPQQ